MRARGSGKRKGRGQAGPLRARVRDAGGGAVEDQGHHVPPPKPVALRPSGQLPVCKAWHHARVPPHLCTPRNSPNPPGLTYYNSACERFLDNKLSLVSSSPLPAPRPPPPPGDEEPGIIPADIVFVLDEKPHPRFRRDGDTLHYTAVLPLADALCGTTLQVGASLGRGGGGPP